MIKKIAVATLLGIVVCASLAVAQEQPVGRTDGDVGIEEMLGEYVPLDLGFVDADGDSIYLRDIIQRPTVISLVYFRCPTICKPLLGSVAEVVEKTNLKPGEDYDLLTISFDETDTPQAAKEMKASFADPINKVGEGGWRFLTADKSTITGFTDAVGFRFARQEKDFAHGSCLIVLSPDGKIVRYLFGLSYLPFDVKMAVTEANQGKVAPTIARVLKYCFSYDPEGRRYVFNVTKVAGASILLLMVGWVIYISTFGRSRKEQVKG